MYNRYKHQTDRRLFLELFVLQAPTVSHRHTKKRSPGSTRISPELLTSCTSCAAGIHIGLQKGTDLSQRGELVKHKY